MGLDLRNFGFGGFLSPVDNPPVVNTVNAGRTIPVKFTLSGDLGLGVLFGTPTTALLGRPMPHVYADARRRHLSQGGLPIPLAIDPVR